MENKRLQEELELLFGEETVKMAVLQEMLARRYIANNPIKIRKALERFQRLKKIEQQKEFTAAFDKEMARAFICAMLCGSASQAVLDLAARAIEDKLAGRAVLGGKIIQKK
ncbi:MAG: hypothetical protein AB1656_00150 [Candidatus Omnitrophota bacterium]